MKYYVESYGCTMNYGEGRQLSDRMSEIGHLKVDSANAADIVVLNTCTVVEITEKKMLARMSELRKAGKQVIVTGCMAKVQPERASIRLPGSLVIPPDEYDTFRLTVESRYGCGDSAMVREDEIFSILPIAQGCLGNCSYCITRFARGPLRSFPEDKLLAEFDALVANGAKEILLTAQDTASYGTDSLTDLPSLIGKMLRAEGDFRIRIGMMNPDCLDRILDDLLDVMEDPRVYRFLHIPVQSGSDAILRKMRRRYTADRFREIVARARARYPDISIATDMITGFPEETAEDHAMSMDLIKELRMDTVNITRFSPRPGTDAVGMTQIHGRIASERSAEMTDLKNKTEHDVNSMLIGKKMTALATENGKEGTIIMRTGNYRPVAVPGDMPLGTFSEIEITGSAPTYLLGRALNK